jgi:tetratricopeptide (TPR) repeat protein
VSQQIRDQLQKTLGSAYTLERELGGGGMSRVFVAEETSLRRKVVVKVLSPELAQGISVERFQREIQVAAALQQANIVPVLSAGVTEGLPFYTMPFAEGESLRAKLARGPMAITEVIGVLRDVSKALGYAHQRGVVHRDIKPDNVLLSGGTAVVTDFGIAKAISASRTESGNATLTQIGTSIGTPAYMSPEQAAGDPGIDHRADIYSLGAMAYELLTGQVVFANRTPQRMLAAHMSETPKPVAELRLDTPAPLAELVMSCLAKDAAQRPQLGTDIARVLDSITSGSGIQTMSPILLGGTGMFKKALAMYAGAFVVVAVVAKAAIVGIGLPDWVFPGSLIVMALGLPVILWTGYVHRVARKAASGTPSFTPGGTPSMAHMHGTMATLALKAAPKMSWYRTARGGAYAMSAFIAIIAAFMIMRQFGIGPFGSLIASGDLSANNRLIIADFTVSSGDSALGRVVGDAIRAGLGDSRVFRILSPSEMAGALQRMQQRPTARVTLELARQMALREGVKAIVDGDVTIVGTSYIVAARLVTADSARELASYRGTASSSDAIINVADEISRKLRAKTGESLRRVQGTPQLAYATTSSLDALRKYSEGARANDVERNYPRAISLLREAVALDSNFAEGWRKLAVALRNNGRQPPSQADSAITRAYRLSSRMTERERDVVLAYYYSGAPGFDRAKAITTYERMLARGDSTVGLNNLANEMSGRRDFARADTLFRAAIANNPSNTLAVANLIANLQRQGRWRERDSLNAVAMKRFATQSTFGQNVVQFLVDAGHLEDARKVVDSAVKAGDPRTPSWPVGRVALLSRLQGKLRESEKAEAQVAAIDSARRSPTPTTFLLAGRVARLLDRGLPADAELRAFEDAVAKWRIDTLPPGDRPYLGIANVYANAGQIDKAKAYVAQYRSALARDTALLRWSRGEIESTEANIAVAEKRYVDAARLARQSDRDPDGPRTNCAECLHTRLVSIFGKGEMHDSVIAAYEAYKKTPMGSRPLEGPDTRLGIMNMELVAKAYDAKGDAENAVKLYRMFVEAWKNADPELQPRVKAARDRIAKLAPVEGAQKR